MEPLHRRDHGCIQKRIVGTHYADIPGLALSVQMQLQVNLRQARERRIECFQRNVDPFGVLQHLYIDDSCRDARRLR